MNRRAWCTLSTLHAHLAPACHRRPELLAKVHHAALVVTVPLQLAVDTLREHWVPAVPRVMLLHLDVDAHEAVEGAEVERSALRLAQPRAVALDLTKLHGVHESLDGRAGVAPGGGEAPRAFRRRGPHGADGRLGVL